MDSITKDVIIPLVVLFVSAWFVSPCQSQNAYSAMRQYNTTVPNSPSPGAQPDRGRPGLQMGIPSRQGFAPGQSAFYGEYPIGAPGRPSNTTGVAYSSDPSWTQYLIKSEDRSFDFGSVPKGAKAEHHFILKNAFQEKVHIASISSSCTCATISMLDNKSELQTYEKAAVVVLFRADLYDGPKSATITVVIDKPYHAEFHLNVRGDIRSDVTIRPNGVRFDNVKEGEEISRTMDVVYSGSNPAWKVVEFRSGNEHLSAEIEDVQSRPGQTTTKIRVRLDEKTPVGKFSDRLYLVTNDSANRREIPILVEATVGTVINITPETLFFGYLKPGEVSSKIVVLQGSKPFRIKKLLCTNPAVETTFTFNEDAPPKIRHIIPIRYQNPKEGPGAPEDGKMRAVVKIETDDPKLTPAFNVTMELAKEEPKEPETKEEDN